MQWPKSVTYYLLLAAIFTLVAYVGLVRPDLIPLQGSQQACAEPIRYAVQEYDERFGISRTEFEGAVEQAVLVWNEAAEKSLFASSSEPHLVVNLLYDERQQAIELGEAITTEQEEYDRMKEGIDVLRDRYVDLQSEYERAIRTFEASVVAYEREVDQWNERGGAPPAVYAQLALQKGALEQDQIRLNSQAMLIQSIGRDINARVDGLNALVRSLNSSAETFNETLGHDFDQGNYVDDGIARTITIFTFEDRNELVRVLIHEFGHALGIGHIENPESIMYSYNIGQSLNLSEEDLAALKDVCGEQ